MQTPIIMTTFRSGSTTFTETATQLAVKYLGVKKYLDEPFTIVNYRSQRHFKVVSTYTNKENESIVYTADPSEQHTRSWVWSKQNIYTEHLRRLEILKENPFSYTFKVMADRSMPEEVSDWCFNNNHPIFLERRDRMAQLVSWCSYLRHPPHYSTSSNYKVDTIPYDKDMCVYFIEHHMHAYDAWKKRHPQVPVVYFEDMVGNHLVQNISKVLGLSISDEEAASVHLKWKPVPYASTNREDLFTSKQWHIDRPMLEDLMYKHA